MFSTAIVCGAGTALSQFLFAEVQPQVSGAWTVDLRTVGAVVVSVVTGCWYIRGWMVRMDFRLDTADRRFNDLDLSMKNRDNRLDRIERILDSLPRGGGTDFITKHKP